MRFRLGLVAVLATLSVGATLPPLPIERLPPIPRPTVTAPAWILYDETNDVTLDGVDVDAPRAMASTTKLMTALLAVESGRLDEIVTVSQRAADIGESEIGLIAGERIRMEMLVAAILIRSGNDAAIAIAEHLAGSEEAFVANMNGRAAELGMDQTSFANPHGLDAEAHFSSPRDLLTLARTALAEPVISELVGTSRYRITDAPDGSVRVAETTNALLTTYPGTVGGKTGFTVRAGLVYVGAAERNGRRLFAAVMGSEGAGAHLEDAAVLFDHGFEEMRIADTLGRGTSYWLSGDPDDQLVALARLHALAVVGRLPQSSSIATDSEPVEPVPATVTLRPDLPGPSEAFSWLWGRSG